MTKIINSTNAADIGGGAGAMILSFSSGNEISSNTNSPTYQGVAKFFYPGTDKVGDITSFDINSWREFGGEGSSIDVRIFDIDNGNVIAELIGIDSFLETNAQDMGNVSNLPTLKAQFEIQLRRIGGGTTAHVGSISINY